MGQAMPSSISSSEDRPEPGQGPNAHHGPLAPGLRLTASDRPGIAQPVPERDVPPHPWARMALIVLLLVAVVTVAWEYKMRGLGYQVGDLGDDPSAWVAQRRRLETGREAIAIVGDSRILYDTNLDRFQAVAGVRPVQLAIEGSNGLPVLEDIADHSTFKGLVIVGMADQSYFRDRIGNAKEALKRWSFESPGNYLGWRISDLLRRHSAMLDPDAQLSKFVARTDQDWRPGVQGPYSDVWKLAINHDDRQTWIWPRIESDRYLHAHAIARWMVIFDIMKPKPDMIAKVIVRTRTAVAKIRARGGEVVFVRPPSAEPLRALEQKNLPRAKGWDALLRATPARGVHFEDMPDAQGLILPEISHLSRPCAVVFTDVYVRALAGITPRIAISPSAPPALHRDRCVPAVAKPQSNS